MCISEKINQWIPSSKRYMSNRFKKWLKVKRIPTKLILCHGQRHEQNLVKNPNETILIDDNIGSLPDLGITIGNTYNSDITFLRNQIEKIGMLYSPISIYFNKDVHYLTFATKKTRKNYDTNYKSLSRKRILFKDNFMNMVYYILKPGGYIEFTDSFIFVNENCMNDRRIISDEKAKILFTSFLGKYASKFDVAIKSDSDIIFNNDRNPNFRKHIYLIKKN